MTDTQVKVNRIFNRLRARLLNTIEQMPFDKSQQDAYKQSVKDITSDSWNDITKILVDEGLSDPTSEKNKEKDYKHVK